MNLTLRNAGLLLGLWLAGLGNLAAADTNLTVPPAALQQWRDARFGMFVHWGPVSLKGTEIGWSRGAEVPLEEYDHLYQHFNPTNFDARAWVKLAKRAGMKYLVFTTKHHDGFCMFNTQQTDFNIMHSPFGRDVVKEIAAACRAEGLRFSTYHSVCDWHHPDFPLGSPGGRTHKPNPNLDRYDGYLRAEVKELITQYGPLQTMWFDVPQEFDNRRGLALEQFTRSLQPDIIINNRSGSRGDYDTPEQRIGKYQFDRPWETCMTICEQWAWKPNDRMKSLKQCLQNLILCAGGDGNLLFNVGPMPDGRIEPRQVQRLQEMGAWLKRYGASIYGTRGGPWKPTKTYASTRVGNYVYLHILGWDGETLRLPALPVSIRKAKVLTGGRAVVEQTPEQVTVTVQSKWHREIDTLVRLELATSAMGLAATSFPSTVRATASNVFQHEEEYSADKAFDDNPDTRWATDAGTHQAWVAIDLGAMKTLHTVRISEAIETRVQRFEFQYRKNDSWETVFSGTTIGPDYHHDFTPVTAREVRLNILEATEGPTIFELKAE